MKKILLGLFLLLCVAGRVEGATFGYETVGSSTDTVQSGRCMSYGPAALPETGTITSIDLYVNNTDGSAHNIACALYADSSGVPGALLASSGSISVAAGFSGWKSCPITDTERSAGNFHFAFMVQDTEILTTYYNFTGSDTMQIDTGLTFPNFANPLVSAYGDNTKYTIRATYTTGSGSTTATKIILGE